jgi:hypothetical protein
MDRTLRTDAADVLAFRLRSLGHAAAQIAPAT